jgi:5-methylcytosine-specific restriction enzyme subunit McrC
MSCDILSNQILKATLNKVLGEQGLKPELRAAVRKCVKMLNGVTDIVLNARSFHEVHMHQNNRLYSFLINVCRFFHDCLEGQDRPGQYRFRDVDRDERRMRVVFEKFVRNFFARRQSIFTVKRDRVRWVHSLHG